MLQCRLKFRIIVMSFTGIKYYCTCRKKKVWDTEAWDDPEQIIRAMRCDWQACCEKVLQGESSKNQAKEASAGGTQLDVGGSVG